MPDPEDYSDDYLAKVLKEDAHASSIKYSALGLQAFLPKRPTAAAPKPNTRFLRNILRETDSHNAALLAKEKREARERERALSKKELGRLSPRGDDSRDHGSERSSGTRRKRGHTHDIDGREGREHRQQRRRSRSPAKSSPLRRVGREDNARYDRKRLKGTGNSSEEIESDRSPERRLEGHKSKRSRLERHERDKKSRHRHRRSRNRSESRSRVKEGRSRAVKSSQHRSRRSSDSTTPRPENESPQPKDSHRNVGNSDRASTPPASDSDPLEAIVGPAPPPPEPKVKAKGRGAFHGSSAAMDSHFASNYDPSVDVQPDPESEDDWEQALEALRDRQKWRQQGADRLRSAGFSETEVKKWEKGGEKDESDVRWAKNGEGREWDRGKVVGDDGVDLKANW